MSFGLKHFETKLYLFSNVVFGRAQTCTSDFVQFEGVNPFPMRICKATVSVDWLLVLSMLEQTILSKTCITNVSLCSEVSNHP